MQDVSAASQLAAIRVEHLEARQRGLRLTLPRTKGERAGKAVAVAIPYGTTAVPAAGTLRQPTPNLQETSHNRASAFAACRLDAMAWIRVKFQREHSNSA